MTAFDPAIFFAALGITMLEIVEASAVGLALYGESRRQIAFVFVALGIIVVFAPLFVVGTLFSYLPVIYVKLVGGVLLLYFGQRLLKSARRAVLNSRKNKTSSPEHFEKGVAATGFSVGAIEAFEAAIVLVGLLPANFQSTVLGMGAGIVVVVGATYALKNQVRKVKQANMKIVVCALLLSFSTLWFVEVAILYSGILYVPISRRLTESSPTLFSIMTSPTNLENLLLIPFFIVYLIAVYKFANRPSPEPAKVEVQAPQPSK